VLDDSNDAVDDRVDVEVFLVVEVNKMMDFNSTGANMNT